ncbi:MAG: hypothetical protein ABI687_03145, partial [Flavitalea sp.]
INNKTFSRSIIRSPEIIGEASKRIDDEFQSLHAEIDISVQILELFLSFASDNALFAMACHIPRRYGLTALARNRLTYRISALDR